jgi:hypothetical protein
MDPKTYALYYFATMSGLPGMGQYYSTEFTGPEPKTFPILSYPSNEYAGAFSYLNSKTHEVSFQSMQARSDGHYLYSIFPLCKGYKVYNEYNQQASSD